MTALRFVVLGLVATGCARQAVKRPALRPVTGLEMKSSWCSPGRGAPPDPTLGVTRPVRVGVASIVHGKDGTTESFLAHATWAGEAFVPERRSEILLVDHPTDADYAVSGSVTGDISYERDVGKDAVAPVLTMAMGYGFGGAGTVLGGTLTAVDVPAGEKILTVGLLLGSVGLASHVYLMLRPSNRYAWSNEAHLVLRRNGVRIGEFVISDNDRTVKFSTIKRYRRHSLDRIWRKARAEIGRCIAADLAQDLGTGELAHHEAPR